MNFIVKKLDSYELNKVLDWLLYASCYTLVISISDLFFDSFYSKNIFYSFIAVIIISILNKTLRPIIFKITIPITALTFGLFYPFINLFILKIVDIILGEDFEIKGLFMGALIAFLISFMNLFIEYVIIKPILRRSEKSGKSSI